MNKLLLLLIPLLLVSSTGGWVYPDFPEPVAYIDFEKLRLENHNLREQVKQLEYSNKFLNETNILWNQYKSISPSSQPEYSLIPIYYSNEIHIRFPFPRECMQYWYLVESGSMRPFLDTGHEVIGTTCFSDLNVGDIIVYKSGVQYVIHQIVDIQEDGVITKGTWNNYVDRLIPFKDVVAVIVVIVY